MDMMSPTIDQIAPALCAAQAILEPAKKNAQNPAFRSKYADLAACFEACRQVLPKQGLAITQVLLPQSDPSLICVRTILLHTSGQWISSDCVLNSGSGGARNPAQAAGSAITYARRYGLCALVGIVADDDDDANACQQVPQRQPQRQAPAPQRPQQNSIQIAFIQCCQNHGIGKENFAQEMTNFFGREINNSKDLTPAEMQDYIDAVAQAQAEKEQN